MKKLLLILILSLSTLPAATGQQIFKKYCVACHIKTDMSPRYNKAVRKAPPMNRVSQRLKIMTDSKEEFIAFAIDYIQNPSQKKGYCRPKAYKNFGTMPPIGKSMTAKERETVVAWLYDNFNSTDDKKRSCATQQTGRSAKCGAGRCGAAKCGGKR